MHLCEHCRDDANGWPLAPEVPVPYTNRHDPHNAREQREALERRCPGSRCHGNNQLHDPQIKLCESCAYQLKICQHCGRTTLTPAQLAAEAAAAKAREMIELHIDLFTIAVKTYGYDAAHALLKAHITTIGTVPLWHTLKVKMNALDDRIDTHPHLKMLFGGGLKRGKVARCPSCRPPWHGTPALTRAEQCRHWTVGVAATWCLFCALDKAFCANCGVSTNK